MLNAVDLARYVVARTNKIAHGVNRLQLEQMLYFIQAEFLVTFGSPCFADDIEACELGIKIRTVRREFTGYSVGRIWYFEDYHPKWLDLNVTPDEKYHIDAVIDELLLYSASDLIRLVQNQEPWQKTYVKGLKRIIPNSLIKDYFNTP